MAFNFTQQVQQAGQKKPVGFAQQVQQALQPIQQAQQAQQQNAQNQVTPIARNLAPSTISAKQNPKGLSASNSLLPGFPGMPNNGTRLGQPGVAPAIDRSKPIIDPYSAEGMAADLSEIEQKHASGFNDTMQAARLSQATNQKRAANINAQMGNSVGGSFAVGLGAAQLGQQQAMTDARTKHQMQGLELRMAALDRFAQRADAEQNRELQKYIADQQNQTLMEIEALRAGVTPGSEGSGGLKDTIAGAIRSMGGEAGAAALALSPAWTMSVGGPHVVNYASDKLKGVGNAIKGWF
jgi:hypothetical protein